MEFPEFPWPAGQRDVPGLQLELPEDVLQGCGECARINCDYLRIASSVGRAQLLTCLQQVIEDLGLSESMLYFGVTGVGPLFRMHTIREGGFARQGGNLDDLEPVNPRASHFPLWRSQMTVVFYGAARCILDLEKAAIRDGRFRCSNDPSRGGVGTSLPRLFFYVAHNLGPDCSCRHCRRGRMLAYGYEESEEEEAEEEQQQQEKGSRSRSRSRSNAPTELDTDSNMELDHAAARGDASATTAAPASMAPTTAAPTTVAPTTAAPTTATNAAPTTTAAPMTMALMGLPDYLYFQMLPLQASWPEARIWVCAPPAVAIHYKITSNCSALFTVVPNDIDLAPDQSVEIIFAFRSRARVTANSINSLRFRVAVSDQDPVRLLGRILCMHVQIPFSQEVDRRKQHSNIPWRPSNVMTGEVGEWRAWWMWCRRRHANLF